MSGVEHVLIREKFCRIECAREATRAEFFVVRFGGFDFVCQRIPQRVERRHELRHLLLQRVLWRIAFGRRERDHATTEMLGTSPRLVHNIT